jgi:hypothetical protein
MLKLGEAAGGGLDTGGFATGGVGAAPPPPPPQAESAIAEANSAASNARLFRFFVLLLRDSAGEMARLVGRMRFSKRASSMPQMEKLTTKWMKFRALTHLPRCWRHHAVSMSCS